MLRKLIRVWIIGIVFPLYAIAGQPSVKITHGPYLQNLSENEVTVVWTTDKPCKSWVEFSKKEDGKSFYSQLPRKAYASQDGLCCVDTLHRVTVTGLEKNTTYFYRVLSQEVKELLPYRPVLGNIVSTDIWKKPLTFTTLDGRQETLSMVMINDIHGKNDLQKKLLEMAPPQNVDMVVFCGDMCNYINKQSDIFTGFLDTSVGLFASSKPFVYVRGNHETRGAYARNFSRYLTGPEGKFYYAFTYGPIRFIVLDSGEDKPDTDVEYSGLVDFDNYILEQKEWLARELESPEFRAASFRVVLSHIPFGKGGWYGSERLRKQLLPLLEGARIDLMLSGHNHTFGFMDKGKVTAFPIIVNSNNSVLTMFGSEDLLKVQVKQIDGKVLLEKEFSK
ncbi:MULTISPECIES: purple acid phosphatase family protein [Barnesiella]|jgi:phosphodiesterase/alkaline phosphatase D-like protein|uniref:purple acid phosphatase family protein n=2 Tax=Barnesiellaceae TaxID=2005519 RepID=UPI00202EB630|nr:metallophosphoesterase family protein [Barnesiella sp. B2-R-119]MCM0688763.1 metallophosphoesterase family protein [Barnesiella sp. B2-R-119]